MFSNILDRMFPGLVIHDLPEQNARLREIIVGMIGSMSGNKSRNSIGLISCIFVEEEGICIPWTHSVGLVVGSRTLVSIHSHWSISMTVVDFSTIGTVDGDLLVISP
jgi:hypothetical protein